VLPSRRLFTAIASDQIELGFGPFQQTMPSRLKAIPLFEDDRSLVIHESHHMRADSIGDPDLLRQVPLIVSHLDDPVERPADTKLRDAFGTIWEITDLSLRLHLVRRGRAMTYLDHRLMATLPDHNALISLDEIAFGRIPLTWGIFHKKDKPLSRGAIEFMEYCRSISFN
ncbi:MAG: LysR substrate-binding domain-containing protein, partial [Pseudomonadota bacterium]